MHSNSQSLHDITELLQNFDISQIQEIDNNPLAKRIFTKDLNTSNSIYLQWSHSAHMKVDISYCVEYGIGLKIGGVEQFKKVYEGQQNFCIIQSLQPKTTYRFRVCAYIKQIVNLEINQQQEQFGEWSEIIQVTTQDAMQIDPISCGSHAIVQKKGSEIWVNFDNPGMIYGIYGYSFGLVQWEIKVIVPQHSSQEDTTACLMIGVTNKTGKKFNIYGTTLNYGFNRDTFKVKVVIDFNKKQMIIYSPTNQNGEIFNSVPQGTLYPAIMNRSNLKNSLNAFKLQINFEN